jgi:hypothetical protein
MAQAILDSPLQYPWTGGMNSCQFCPIDINLDGKPDLLIFDQFGNRILPWIKYTVLFQGFFRKNRSPCWFERREGSLLYKY